MATLSKGAAKLREQMNRTFPKRDTRSDGWLGDAAHAARKSDHNPDKDGIVHAIDLDADFGPPSKDYALRLANDLVAYAKSGRKGSDRVKYVIFRGRIASAQRDWAWRKYTGSNPHTGHIHLSVTKASDADGSSWPLPVFTKP